MEDERTFYSILFRISFGMNRKVFALKSKKKKKSYPGFEQTHLKLFFKLFDMILKAKIQSILNELS